MKLFIYSKAHAPSCNGIAVVSPDLAINHKGREKRRYSAFDSDGLYGASAVRWHGSGFSAGHLIADRFWRANASP